MNLAEMLTFTASEFLDDRTELISGDPDSLWSDELLVRYFNEGQRILARRSWCIIDEGNAHAGVIVLATGKVVYPLHKSVLRVLLAVPTDQEWPLAHADNRVLRTSRPFDDWIFDVNDVSTSSPGRPIAFSTNAGTRIARLYREPTADENGLRLVLTVARLPVTWLTLDDTEAEPEVPEDYHFLVCQYAAGRCLTQPTVDGQQKTDGRLLLAEFNEGCKEARQDRQRAEMHSSCWGFDTATALL